MCLSGCVKHPATIKKFKIGNKNFDVIRLLLLIFISLPLHICLQYSALPKFTAFYYWYIYYIHIDTYIDTHIDTYIIWWKLRKLCCLQIMLDQYSLFSNIHVLKKTIIYNSLRKRFFLWNLHKIDKIEKLAFCLALSKISQAPTELNSPPFQLPHAIYDKFIRFFSVGLFDDFFLQSIYVRGIFFFQSIYVRGIY